VLTRSATETYSAYTTGAFTVTAGTPTATGGVVGNNKTVYVDAKNTTSYTGFANVPTITVPATGAHATVVKDGYAKIIFMVGGAVSNNNATRFFVINATSGRFAALGSSTNLYYEVVSAYVDGLQTEKIYVDSATRTAIMTDGIGMYVAKSSKLVGTVTVITEVEADTMLPGESWSYASAEKITASSSGTISTGTETYVVNDNTSVYTVKIGTTNSIENRGFTDDMVGLSMVVQVVGKANAAEEITAKNIYVFESADTYARTFTAGTYAGASAGGLTPAAGESLGTLTAPVVAGGPTGASADVITYAVKSVSAAGADTLNVSITATTGAIVLATTPGAWADGDSVVVTATITDIYGVVVYTADIACVLAP